MPYDIIYGQFERRRGFLKDLILTLVGLGVLAASRRRGE